MRLRYVFAGLLFLIALFATYKVSGYFADSNQPLAVGTDFLDMKAWVTIIGSAVVALASLTVGCFLVFKDEMVALSTSFVTFLVLCALVFLHVFPSIGS